jgi:predicted lipoprotein with Yx(FWY)xxD motif
MRLRPLHTVVLGALGLALVAAGCGGAIPSSNGGPATLKLSQGKFLVDAQGHSLYLFEKDENGESYCGGACAAVWPPLETDSMPHAAGGLQTAALGTIKRDDGDMQVTYHGHPLYYYAADASTPGKTKGEGLDQFGNEWYLVGANGKTVEETQSSPEKQHSGSNSGSSSGSTGGGGGWG